MGMWDQLFNEGDAEPSALDYAKAFIPVAGPIMAMSGLKKKKSAARNRWLTDNLAYTNPEELPELGQRVQQRMLSRTGGELSEPGLIAATAMRRAANDPRNMGNIGNVAMQTSSALAAAGQPSAALRAGVYAHENLQTPWKLSEGGAEIENFYNPKTGHRVSVSNPAAKDALIANGYQKVGVGDPPKNTRRVTGRDLGMAGDAANDVYEQEDYDPSFPNPTTRKLDNATKVSLHNYPESAIENADPILREFEGTVGAAMQMRHDLAGLKANTTASTIGLPGAITRIAETGMGIGEYAVSLGRSPEEKQVIQSAIQPLTALAQRFSMEGIPAALSNYYVISLAYAIARRHNMGTLGGGRGITDADMKYAVGQLQSAKSVRALNAVLDAEEKLQDQIVDIAYQSKRAYFQDPSDIRLGTIDAHYNMYKSKYGAGGGVGGPASPQTLPQHIPMYNPKTGKWE
jgi:hypothetical protein